MDAPVVSLRRLHSFWGKGEAVEVALGGYLSTHQWKKMSGRGGRETHRECLVDGGARGFVAPPPPILGGRCVV